MYESHYGFTCKPFVLSPNPDFLYLSPSHRKALTYLEYAVEERSGFMLLTGEIGSGKTTIIRKLQQNFPKEVVFARISYTILTGEQLLSMINEDFGLNGTAQNKVESLRLLNSFLVAQYGAGKKPLLIIDEAQNLSVEILEELRMLSNLEADDAKLLQILLVGQPELRATIYLPAMQQLRQRISIFCTIMPLSFIETYEYIYHRLAVAGNRNAVKFSKEAVTLIWQQSRGIPRLINIICDFVLLAAFADGTTAITAVLVREIVADMGIDNHFWGDKTVPAAVKPAATPARAGAAPRPQLKSVVAKEVIELETLDEIVDKKAVKGER